MKINKGDQFKCSCCKRHFRSAWTAEEMIEDYEAFHGFKYKASDAVIICEACDEKCYKKEKELV